MTTTVPLRKSASLLGCYLAITWSAALLSGCSSTQDSFYLLTAEGPPLSTRSLDGKSVGVGPLTLPDYIDRAELVFQSDTNRFQVPPDQRWAGDLRENISDVVAVNLGRRLKNGEVSSYPWQSGKEPRHTVAIRIRQFHAVSGGDAILDVRWDIREGSNGKMLSSDTMLFTEGLSEEGYTGIVAAQSRLLGQLADAIAAALP